MKVSRRAFGRIVTGLGLAALPVNADTSSIAAVWVSSVDRSRRLSRAENVRFERIHKPESSPTLERISISPSRQHQKMLGFGSSLEPSTCWNLSRLDEKQKRHCLTRLLSPTNGIGMNLMRVCIGTPDFTGDPWYSYDDLPIGQTDPELKSFSIQRDRRYILPILKLAKEINPALLYFASAWSPPGWMKSSGSLIGGSLLPKWYSAYADYLVRFIQAYGAAGIPLYAITVQNEPGVDREKEKDPKWFYPSCHWTAEQERDFIRDHLGPAIKRNQLRTRIWCYDHNYNELGTRDDAGIDYPRTILKDVAALKYVSGVAFHGYVGNPSGMSVLQTEFPEVPMHFTEGSVFGINGARELIERLRNNACSYNAWVTMLDTGGKPNNGPFAASRTILSVNPSTLEVSENFDFDMYGQFMKFVARGARRIASSEGNNDIANVAFRNPDGRIVVIIANYGGSEKSVAIEIGRLEGMIRLQGNSIATLVL